MAQVATAASFGTESRGTSRSLRLTPSWIDVSTRGGITAGPLGMVFSSRKFGSDGPNFVYAFAHIGSSLTGTTRLRTFVLCHP